MASDNLISQNRTSVIWNVTLRDSTSGGGKTGVAHSAITAYYSINSGTPVAITLASGSVGDSYSSGKWAEVSSTNMKGQYAIHLPNAMFATLGQVKLQIQGTGFLDCPQSFIVGVPDNRVAGTGFPALAAGNVAHSIIVSYDEDKAPYIALRTVTSIALSGTKLVLGAGDENLLPLIGCYVVGYGDSISPVSTSGLQVAQVIGASDGSSGDAHVIITPAFSIETGVVRFFPSFYRPQVGNVTGTVPDSSGTTTLLSRLSAVRAAFLDFLNIGGNVASASQVTALYNMARVSLDVPPQILIPDSGTKAFVITARLYDSDTGEMEAPDSTPTLTATLGDGTDVSARLGTASNPSTGVYRWTYTSSSAHALNDQVRFDVTFTENSATISQGASGYTVDNITTDFTASDRTALLDTQTKAGTAATQATTAATQATAAATSASAIQTVLSGITSLANWLRALSRKANNNGTAISEINATTGVGTGTYDPTTDSPEALRDRGDSGAWGGGGGGGGLTGSSSVTLTFTDAAPAPIGPIAFTIVGQGSARSSVGGIAAFGLNDGTYTVTAAPKNGVIFSDTTLVVSGTTTLTIAGALPAIDPPVSPDQSTGFLVCYDAAGLPVVGATISFTMVRGPGSDGSSFGTQMTAVSGSMGLLQGSFVKGAIYEATRGTSGKSVRFAVPLTGTSFPIPETLGRD